MNDQVEQEFRELTDWVRLRRIENISQTRSFFHQVLILAGAIATFLMPAYMMAQLTPFQHAFIALALCCLLIAILFGVISLSYVLGKETRELTQRQEGLEKKDIQLLAKIKKEQEKQKPYASPFDAPAIILLSLFVLGILSLMVGIAIGVKGL
ncbi:MAG: hypothetical protein KKB30_17115 [Proteobacteria bacterium]|nr:hypothetical protein [Pseudomonadota bacterium]MBU1739890.1 hypothetical protein [Pseudomonadota bacterium]MBU1858220.1 hypothetical protein [Verrucomicrobiota bacterium]